MLELSCLYDTVDCKKISIDPKKKIIVRDIPNERNGLFNAVYLKKVLSIMKPLLANKIKNRDLQIHLHGAEFGDESVVLYFELIIYSLIKSGYKKIHLFIEGLSKESFNYKLYEYSRLNMYVSAGKLVNVKLFERDFEDYCILDKEHGYRIIHNDFEHCLFMIAKNDGDINIPSYACTIIKKYLDSFNCFGPKFKRNFVKMVGEIVDNSISHTKSDCIVSFKQFIVYDSETKQEKLMISVAIANFSESLLYSHIKNNLFDDDWICGAKQNIISAYNNNVSKFNDLYDLDFFCMVSAFQRCITTRKDAEKNSGRGLTKFLEYIISFSVLDQCYVYSDDKLLWFTKKLHCDANGMVGFNDSNDYLNDIPSIDNIKKLEYNNKGTLFNLKLVYDWSGLID